MLSKTSAATRANVNGTVFCARSDNDTGNNPHNPMYGINKAGANGDLVALVGSEPSDSGGNSMSPMAWIDPAVRPDQGRSRQRRHGPGRHGQARRRCLNQTQAGQVATAAEQISAIKLAKVAEDPNLEELIHCGYVQTADLISRFGNPDAREPGARHRHRRHGGLDLHGRRVQPDAASARPPR